MNNNEVKNLILILESFIERNRNIENNLREERDGLQNQINSLYKNFWYEDAKEIEKIIEDRL